MRSALTLAAVLGLAAAPAMAQSSSGSTTTQPQSNQAQSSQMQPGQMQPGQMQEAVKNDLSQAGFTDIHVMPSSFLVRAKDKGGRPVMMLINPDSVTEITNVGTNGTNGTNGTDTTKK